MPTTGADRSGATRTRRPLASLWCVRSNEGAGNFTGRGTRLTLRPGAERGRTDFGEPGPEVGRRRGALVEHWQRHLLGRRVDLIVGEPDTEEDEGHVDRGLQGALRSTAALTGRQHLGAVEGQADRVAQCGVGGRAERDEAGADARALPLDVGDDALGRVLGDELLDALDDLGRILVG